MRNEESGLTWIATLDTNDLDRDKAEGTKTDHPGINAPTGYTITMADADKTAKMETAGSGATGGSDRTDVPKAARKQEKCRRDTRQNEKDHHDTVERQERRNRVRAPEQEQRGNDRNGKRTNGAIGSLDLAEVPKTVPTTRSVLK